jgi:hypothetical protein
MNGLRISEALGARSLRGSQGGLIVAAFLAGPFANGHTPGRAIPSTDIARHRRKCSGRVQLEGRDYRAGSRSDEPAV